MNQELISLAKTKPFEFTGYFCKEWEHHSKEPLRWYFWLQELKKWIEETYQYHLHSNTVYYPKDAERYWSHSIFNLNDRDSKTLHALFEYETEQESLEESLIRILKILKEEWILKQQM